MEELKPCPFCGGDAYRRELIDHYPASADGPAGSYSAWFHIGCNVCGIEVGDEYESSAIAAWNRRAARSSLSAQAEEPVAWRSSHRNPDGIRWGDWRYTSHQPQGPASEAFKIEPLYATPPIAAQADRRDAERYRWLRSGVRMRHGETMPLGGRRVIDKNKISAMVVFHFWCSQDELDAAIDAAMSSPLRTEGDGVPADGGSA